ncbi:hypothetical protein J25TS5_41110 [Paenibacillus faecis]|uniref:hypothetical protein n=1 Tax=Paenibacillus faecis TaxID=862114 RepID=UPI001B02F7FF|nr:hypothetical protein [Paenibacillus faecis]GIO87179.1 hypothetical protein J25TS5_41110 [Paenibacillus faecis]
MEKKTYYVSLQGRSLLEDQGATGYEWEIRATPEEADTIRHMLEQIDEKEVSTFFAYTYPWPDSPEEDVNASYQSQVDELYRQIYKLGTEETREQLHRSLRISPGMVEGEEV